MNVINTIVYKDNPYNTLLYRGLSRRYVMTAGSVAEALEALGKQKGQILHLHWEEGFLRRCRTRPEAEMVASYLDAELRAFVDKGGKLVWTIHNALPHELEYADTFLNLRAGLARVATKIIVHNLAAISTLAAQSDLDRVKVALTPHPSYLGVYEPEARTFGTEPDMDARRLLFFGKLRRYKGLEFLIEAARAAPDVEIDVIGEPLTSEVYVEEIARLSQGLANLRIDPRRVADEETPDLLRAYRGLVLPYERFLTSGVALLAMTFGQPAVAPDLPQMREILPPSAQSLLYAPGNAEALAEKMRQLRDMPQDEFAAMRADLLERARYYRPARVSERLFDLFDRL